MDNLKDLDRIRTDIGIMLIYSLQQMNVLEIKAEALIRKQQQIRQQREMMELKAAELAKTIAKQRAKAKAITEMIGDNWTIPNP